MSKKNKIPKDPPQPDVPFAIATLEIAIQNLKASRCLYENSYYPEAVFFLQQGIEKGCKSFGFYYGKIRKSDVYNKSFQHKGIAVYDLTLKQLQLSVSDTRKKIVFVKQCQNNLSHTSDFFDDIEKEIIESQRKLQFFSENSEKYYFISESELEDQIKKLNEIDNTLNEFDKTLEDTLKSYNISKTIKEKATSILETIIDEKIRSTSDRYQQFIKSLDNETILTIIHFNTQGLGAFGPLLNLAIISYPHENRSRYADQGLPKEIYTEKLPLIRHFHEICDIGDRTLDRLRKMYDYLPPPGGSQI